MRISPLDIRKQNFKGKMRGADPEEVRVFLDVVATEFEQVLQENAMMAERLRAQDARLTEFRALEEAMRNALVTADRIAVESRESSERESHRLVQDAHLRAERILEDARERLQSLIAEIEALRGKKEIFARRFWALLESQVGVLQEHLQDNSDVRLLRERIERLQAEIGAASAEHQMIEPPAGRAGEPESLPPGFDPRSGGVRAFDPRQADPRFVPGSQPARTSGPWSDAARSEPPRPEPVRTAPAWPEASRPEPTRSDPASRFEAVPVESAPIASYRQESQDPVPVIRPAGTSPWPGELSPSRAAEERRAAAPAPAAPAAERGRGSGFGFGLKGLLHRGKQEQLPLDRDGAEAGAEAGEGWADAGAPAAERREGVFEFRAGETAREDALARFRSGPPPDQA